MTRIRAARAGDLAIICDFNARMAVETEGLELDRDRLRSGVRRVLGDPGRGRYFLADEGDRVVAQTMITYEWSDWRDAWFWWIQSVYVHPDGRGAGLFRMLLEHIEKLAVEQGDVCGIRLYVDSDNRAAARVYDRLGLAASSYRMREKILAIARGALC